MLETITTSFSAPYMQRALIVGLCLAVLAASVGVHVVLRRLAFATETLQHTVFPGIAVAFAAGASLLVGAAAAAALTVVLFLALRNGRTNSDSVLAVIMTTALGLGVVVVSQRSGFSDDLTSLLFGRMLSIDSTQVTETLILTAAVLFVIVIFHRRLLLSAFDPVASRALGHRSWWLDLVLLVCIAVSVVAAVRAVGTVLLLAFLLTPAVAGRLAGRRLVPIWLTAAGVGAVSVVLGLVVSRALSIEADIAAPAGATVVLVMTVLCLAAGLFRKLVPTSS